MAERHPCKELHDQVQVTWGNLLLAKSKAGKNDRDPNLQIARTNHQSASQAYEECVDKHGHP